MLIQGLLTVRHDKRWGYEEISKFLKKINRGRADITEKRSVEELTEIHSKNNDVYNSDAWDFYCRHL